jgi:hypothetical protein
VAHITFRPGVRKNDSSKPRLFFAGFKRPGVQAPASTDFTRTPDLGMQGNDQWGDCVLAGNAHSVEQQTYYGQGLEARVGTADTLKAYSRVTGFDPDAGPPGENPTDQGTDIQDGLNDLRKNGLPASDGQVHRLTVFAQVDTRQMPDVQLAVAEFGSVAVTMAFPNSAMDQFNAGEPWDVVPDDGGIEGGHRVTLMGYNSSGLIVATWGTVHLMTYPFWNRYVAGHELGGAWAQIFPDWVSKATAKDPLGVDQFALGQQFAALTGDPNPFPAPAPPPQPTPDPDPTPTPPPSPVTPPAWAVEFAKIVKELRAVADAAEAWLKKHALKGDDLPE